MKVQGPRENLGRENSPDTGIQSLNPIPPIFLTEAGIITPATKYPKGVIPVKAEIPQWRRPDVKLPKRSARIFKSLNAGVITK
ncbi:MAG: hypothetical protein ABSE95_01565 [Thermodesulfobacteriota bacterium]